MVRKIPNWRNQLVNTLGRASITGTLQTNEVIRLLIGTTPIARAPRILVYDGHMLTEFGYPNDVCKLLEPEKGKYWDYGMF